MKIKILVYMTGILVSLFMFKAVTALSAASMSTQEETPIPTIQQETPSSEPVVTEETPEQQAAEPEASPTDPPQTQETPSSEPVVTEETPEQQAAEPEASPTDPPQTQETPTSEPVVTEETPEQQAAEPEASPTDPPQTQETPVASEESTEEPISTETETPQPVATEEELPPTPEAEANDLGIIEEVNDPTPVTFACDIQITDAGDTNPFTFDFAAINVQGFTNFDWAFGDGNTASGPNVTHTYTPTAGTYPVTLNCRIDGINDVSLAGTVTTTPTAVAAFTINPMAVGFSPFSISLANDSTGDGLSYLWQVSGPEPHPDDTATNPSYVFTTPGIYTITLTATDAYGYTTSTQQAVTVVSSAITCDFTGPLVAAAGDTSTYTSTVTDLLGRTANYSWTITGPNTHATYTTQDISHTWGDMGTYQIALTVSAVDTNTGHTTNCETVTQSVQVEGLESAFEITLSSSYAIVVSGSCVGNTPTFTITNNGPDDMIAPEPFTITDAGGTNVTPAPGTFQLAAGASTTIGLTGLNPYAAYTLNYTGTGGTVTDTVDCVDPVIVVNSACADTPTFTITNNGGDMLIAQSFTITDLDTGTNVTPAPGTFQLAAGGSTIITLSGGTPYGPYLFNTSGFAGDVSHTYDCTEFTCDSLILSTTPVVAGQELTITPIVINTTSRSMVWERFRISGPNFSIAQSFRQNGPNSYTVTLPGPGDYRINYRAMTENEADFCSITLTITVVAPPVYTISVSGSCTGTGPIFTITNNGPDNMIAPEPFTITDAGGNDVTPAPGNFQLAAGASTTIGLTGLNPYDAYTLNYTGTGGTVTDTVDCVDPVIAVTTVCADTPNFTITNNGGDMLLAQSFTITDVATGNDITPAPGNFQLAAGASTTISLTGLNPYAAYTFNTTGLAGTANVTSDCVDPVIAVTTVCADTPNFTITNNGGDMLLAQSFTITDAGGNDVTPAPGNFQLAAGASTTISLTGLNPYPAYTFNTTGLAGTANVTSDCVDPVIAVTTVCADTPNFTITNNGGDMLLAQSFTITDVATGNDVTPAPGNFQLAAGASTTISLTGLNPYPAYTFNTTGLAGTANVTSDCVDPVIAVTTVCADTPNFTITNNGGDMLLAQPFTITDAGGNDVTPAPGNFQLAAGASTTISLTGLNPYPAYTFNTTGLAGTANVTSDCVDPVIAVTTVCADTPNFTITNNGGDMLLAQPFTITDVATGNDVTPAPGNFQLAAGASTTISLTGLNPYPAYTFNTTGLAGTANVTSDCVDPVIAVTTVCADTPNFTITNNGGDMLLAQPFTITDVATGNDVTPAPGNFQLAAGASTTISLTGLNPYPAYTFNTTGLAGTANVTSDCVDPVIAVTTVCADTPNFTITNNGGDMLLAQPFTITDVATGNDVTPAPGNFQLAAGASTTISLTGLNPYPAYTFNTTGLAGTANVTSDCVDPVIAVTTVCADTPNFTITNNGGDMLLAQPFTITDVATGNDITPAPGNFQLAAGASTTISLTGLNPYPAYTFNTTGLAGTANANSDCVDPVIAVTTVCADTPNFTITNNGGDMLIAQPFTITDVATGNDVTPAPGNFQLAAGASTTISLTGLNPYPAYTFNTTGLAGTTSATSQCQVGPPITIPPTVEPPTTIPPTVEEPPLTVIEDVTLPPPTTTNVVIEPESIVEFNKDVPVCNAVCIPFEIYHTNETGDWKIFRLDHDVAGDPARTNLSYGAGDDMAPSLSPNGDWIVFTSNRDSVDNVGNWEIYIASTTGNPDSVRRITFNHHATDTDPVWGPNQFIVYESSRDGNWELYIFDVITGSEYRLTDHQAQDINPAWSPDGSKVVFQSDRDGFWQIYEVDLATLAVRRLSDGAGPDLDASYSSDGSQIAFRSYRDNGNTSVIYVMNADGSNPFAITQPDEDATNPAWSVDNSLIAYQSDLDGDLDIYVYEISSGQTRQLTDNNIPDYAPAWRCSDGRIVFTSDIMGNPDIFSTQPLPISSTAIRVEESAEQLTYELSDDVYPLGTPSEENASREGQTVDGTYSGQTQFLYPNMSLTPVDVPLPNISTMWEPIDICSAT